MKNEEKDTTVSFFEHNLNENQYLAATQTNGPLLVIAGAGSGKTRVITARITYLITQHNISPSSIVALTFTNKAAREMKERITRFLGSKALIPFVGTFHAYCIYLLKRYKKTNTSHSFSILDEDDQQKIVRNILQKNNLHKQFSPRQVCYQISYVKNQLSDPDMPTHTLFANPLLHEIYLAYEQEKKNSNCLDFDDLLLETVRLFKNDSEFKKTFQKQVQHILVDEYQDTNIVQHELLKSMTTDNGSIIASSICAVGDEDQSIYSWRGATIANILNFKKDFPSTVTIKIEQNYRSVQPILEIANAIIRNNSQRNHKELWSARAASDRVRMLKCLSEYQEAECVAHFVAESIKKDNSTAILYRTHAQSRALEEALIRRSIPYTIIGGVQFYERKEIKDLLAYLKLIINPFDRPSFCRIINVPLRGLGQKFEEMFLDMWQEEPFLTFNNVAERIIEKNLLTGTKLESLKAFLKIFHAISSNSSSYETLEQLIASIGYFSYLKDQFEPQDAQSRIENVKELIAAARHFAQEGNSTIEDFLHEIALLQDKIAASENEEKRVFLMTLHAAKGLEFDSVALTGLEEGILPSTRSLYEGNALEEERRLLYVGITRSRERLLITHARYRCTYGQMNTQFSSRFLDEMPRAHVKMEDASNWHTSQHIHFFTDWFYGNKKTISIHHEKIEPKVLKKNDTTQKTISHAASWKQNQPVKHAKYGIGVIQKIEERSSGDACLTVKFKTGIKKIMASFVQAI